ncbi:MAG: hypothetical protein ABIH00_06155 [Armatimonadota bacterium]
MINQNNNTNRWFVFFITAEIILLILAIPFIFKLLGINSTTPVHVFLKDYEYISIAALIIWAVLVIIFIIFLFKKGVLTFTAPEDLWQSHMEEIFFKMKISVDKKKKFLSTFYEGNYQNLNLRCSLHTGDENSPNFVDIKVYHSHPLNLGLVIRNKGVVRFEGGEGRDIFAKTIHVTDPQTDNMIDIYAKNKDTLESMLFNMNILEPLSNMINSLTKMGVKPSMFEKMFGGKSGFYMTDKYISVRIKEDSVLRLNFESIETLIKNAYKLSIAFTANMPAM